MAQHRSGSTTRLGERAREGDRAREDGTLRISRAGFLRLIGLGGAGTALAALTALPVAGHAAVRAEPRPLPAAQETPTPPRIFVKDEAPLLQLYPIVLGTPWFRQTTFITPIEQTFVRNRYATPRVDPATWQLTVTGDAIDNPLTLSYDDLLALPRRSAIHLRECYGNSDNCGGPSAVYRGFAVASQAEWDYVPIGEILDRAKVKSNALQLLFWSGVDGPDTGRPMPMAEVLARPQAIGLAFGMNGGPLPPDHGGPVRAHVPGWGGAASVKWLTEIRISSHRFWTRMHTLEEALIGPDYPAEQPSPGDELLGIKPVDIRGVGATWQNVKSWLTLPLVVSASEPPGRYPLAKGELPSLPAGPHTLRGYATSPWGIKMVEYSADSGASWQAATLVPPFDLEYAWVRFEFPWQATPGTHTLMTRATDKQGTVQPNAVPSNEIGLLCNAVPKFDVTVT
jgi:sulfane dehydrogenase subunit SoxC